MRPPPQLSVRVCCDCAANPGRPQPKQSSPPQPCAWETASDMSSRLCEKGTARGWCSPATAHESISTAGRGEGGTPAARPGAPMQLIQLCCLANTRFVANKRGFASSFPVLCSCCLNKDSRATYSAQCRAPLQETLSPAATTWAVVLPYSATQRRVVGIFRVCI